MIVCIYVDHSAFVATPDERAAYLKMRRAVAGMVDDDGASDEDETIPTQQSVRNVTRKCLPQKT